MKNKAQAPRLSFVGKVFSVALLIFVMGALAFFVFHHKNSPEAQRRTHPRTPASARALALANTSGEMVIRS